MKSFLANRSTQIRRCPAWLTCLVALSWLSGCQSMMANKQKQQQIPQDHFSCGERTPISSVPRSALK